ncbi:MAG: response regulator, partial [Okeania sp. SIO2F4]|uniref:response regulator n=1 Tax=Okeania sp. SIO2F4 TaxID=2607790 RepID=UPI00142CEB04
MSSSLTNSEHGNILVVDDTPANLQLLIGLLSYKGYTVRPIPSGKLALQGIHLDYPDLILLDIQMPDMTSNKTKRAYPRCALHRKMESNSTNFKPFLIGI